MKNLFLLFCLLLLVVSGGSVVTEAASSITFSEQTQVVLLDKKEAAIILAKTDEYINALSPFDRSAKTKLNREVSTAEFLALSSKETLDWTPNEIVKINVIFESIKQKIKLFHLRFPDKIFIISTTGAEEGGAPYTRQNAIILSSASVQKLTQDLEKTIIHELFHIYSRYNPEKRSKLYNIIGFYQSSELSYPVEIKDLRITNPDAPFNNYYINLLFEGQTVKAIPLIFSSQPNVDPGKTFFDYLVFRMLAVDVNNTDVIPLRRNGQLQFVSLNSSFFRQVGYNTNYIIHPEEILADNFEMMVNQKQFQSPFVPEGMKRVINE